MVRCFSRRRLWGALGCSLLVFSGVVTVHSQSLLQVGYGVLRAGPESALPVAAALFSFRNQEGVLVAEAGVAAVAPMRRGRIFVDASALTGLALANPSDFDLTIGLTLRDADGAVIDRTSLLLPAGRQMARFLSQPELFGNLPESFVGSVSFEVQGEAGVAPLSIRQALNARGERLFATLPVAPLDGASPTIRDGSSSIVLPHVGAGGGLTTEISLINPGPQAMRGEIRVVGSDGQPLELELNGQIGSTFPFRLAADGVFLGKVTSRSERPLAGYALVTVQQGAAAPAGAALFQLRDRTGNLLSEASVGATAATTRSRLFVDTVGTRTGVALASPGNQRTEAVFRLLDRNGLDFAEASRTLSAGGRLSLFVDELFPELPAGFTGVLEIVSQAPLAPVTLKLTINRRGDPILTTLPVADLTRPVEGSLAVFPQVAFGQGFSTRLLLLSGSDRATSAGTVTLSRSDGDALAVPVLGQPQSRLAYEVLSSAVVQLRPGEAADAALILLQSSLERSSEITVNRGDTTALRPVVVDTAGAYRDDFPLQFASLDEEVASVDRRGRIIARKAGFSTLTVSAGGARTTRTVTVVEATFGPTASQVAGVAQDLAGRLYLADRLNDTILRSESLGAVPEVYAGLVRRAGFRDGRRSIALFDQPASLALDQATGELYASDVQNHRIRRLSPGSAGRVETLAGSGRQGAEDGPVASAAFDQPEGIVFDRLGNLWVADRGNHAIRRIDCGGRDDCAQGMVETIAGALAQPGFADGRGGQVRFDSPIGIALERESAVARAIRRLRGDQPPPVAVLVADAGNGRIRRVSEDGTVETVSSASSRLDSPSSVAVDELGNIWVGEAGSGTVKAILRTGQVASLAQAGTFQQPVGLLTQVSGSVLVADAAAGAVLVRHGAPTIEAVIPETVPSGRRSFVTVIGRNFSPDAAALVGGVAPDFEVRDSRTIVLEIPPLPSGARTLSVHARGGLAQRRVGFESVPLEALPPGRITTIAGGSSLVGDGRMATDASLDPRNMSFDSAGNLYVVDRRNFRIRKIDARTGIASTVAGTGSPGFSGEGELAVSAALASPFDVAVDPSGNLFIASGPRVRRVDARTGIIRTVAGGGSPEDGLGDGLKATEASLSMAVSLALDGAGNLFISDLFRSRIRRVDAASGIITTVAGNGNRGYSGDGGPATSAQLSFADSIAVDRDGNLFIADSRFNRRVRRVDAQTGIITTVAGIGCARDANAFPWDCPPGDGGLATRASLREITDLALGPSGDLFIADLGDGRVRKVDSATGTISTVVGAGCSSSTGECESDENSLPIRARAISVDGSGSLTIAAGFTLSRVNAVTGALEAAGGNGQPRVRGDGGPASLGSLWLPYRAAFDESFNLYIAEPWGRAVRKIDRAAGSISTIALSETLDPPPVESSSSENEPPFPEALALDGEELLYVSNAGVIERVDLTTGASETIASTPGVSQMIVLADGNLAATIPERNQVVRFDVVSGGGNVVAGKGAQGFDGDGGPAIEALLDSPTGLSSDLFGNLYVADSGNHRIRRIDRLTGLIQTVAGLGVPGFSGDGGPALEARLQSPRGVTVDCRENIFIADSGNRRIRRVDALTGIVSTVAGGVVFANEPRDGLEAIDARLRFPRDLILDQSGNLLIVDAADHRIRAIRGLADAAVLPGRCSPQ